MKVYMDCEGKLSTIDYKMNRLTYSLLSESEKGKITDGKNVAVNHDKGIRIEWN